MNTCEGKWETPSGKFIPCVNEVAQVVAGMHLCQEHVSLYWQAFRGDQGGSS